MLQARARDEAALSTAPTTPVTIKAKPKAIHAGAVLFNAVIIASKRPDNPTQVEMTAKRFMPTLLHS